MQQLGLQHKVRPLLLWLLAFCMAATGPAAAVPTAVSTDFCADQYLLALADRSQILAVSPDAEAPFSHMAAKAGGVRKLAAGVEELAALQPDYVVTSWGWSAHNRGLPERLGAKFVQVQFGTTPDVIAANLRHVGGILRRESQAEKIVAEMFQRLQDIETRVDRRVGTPPLRPPLRGMYITPSGTTSGAGTLVDEIITRAGLINAVAEMGYSGWQQMQLEDLVVNPPDLFVASFFELNSAQTDNWNIARHSVMQRLLEDRPVILVPSNKLSCAAWYFVDAVEMLINEVDQAQILSPEQLRAGGLR